MLGARRTVVSQQASPTPRLQPHLVAGDEGLLGQVRDVLLVVRSRRISVRVRVRVVML